MATEETGENQVPGNEDLHNKIGDFFDDKVDEFLKRSIGGEEEQKPEKEEAPEPKEEEEDVREAEQHQEDEPEAGSEKEQQEEGEEDVFPKLTEEGDEEPSQKPQEAAEEEDEPEDPYTPPKFKKRLDRAKERAAKEAEKRAAEKYEAEIAELKKQIDEGSGSNVSEDQPEPVSDAEREELIMLRRKFAAENDPEIRNQYDNRIVDSREAISDVLGKYFSHPDDEQARKNFDHLYQSNPESARKLLEEIEKKNPVDAQIITAKIGDIMSLKRGKQRAVDEAAKTAKEWFEQQEQKKQQQEQLSQQEVEQRRSAYLQQFDGILQNKQFQPLPTAGLEGEQLKKAEADNSVRDRMRRVVEAAKKATSPADVARLTSAAALAVKFEAENKALKNELDAVKKRLDERINAGQVSKRNRATAPTTRKEKKPESSGDFIRDFDQRVQEIIKS